MEFSKCIYALVGVWLPLAAIFVVFACAFLINRYLVKKQYHLGTIMFLWIMVLVFLLYGLAIFSQGLKYPISAVVPQNVMQYITVGNVEQVESAPCPPAYFNPVSKQFGPAKFVTVDGIRFYLPYGDVQIGQAVELRWATEECVVYAYRVLPPEEQFVNSTYPVNPPVQSNSNVQIGSTIATVSAVLFALAVALQHPLGKVMAPRFIQKDQKFRDRIVPNRFGLLYACVKLLPMCGIFGGLALRGFGGAIIVFLVGIFFIGRLVLKKQTTTVSLEERMLVVKDWKTVYRIDMDSVKTIEFVESRLPYNRCLMLTLKNGMIFRFEQENFWGLENMYAKLSHPFKQNPNYL